MRKKPKVLARRMAGEDHAVVTVQSDSADYQRQPCKECPWRKANTGSFPPEAFKHSADTAMDMSSHTFACHMKGVERTSVCAGFLLVGADDNMSVRIARIEGRMLDVHGDIEELHASYKAMAIANGVDPDDPALKGCMPEARNERWKDEE